MPKPLPGRFKRILVCQLRQIGDVLLATPAIELLDRAWPEAEIHVLTEARCAPVLENNPHVDRVWALDKKRLDTLPKQLAYYRQFGRMGFDLVVDFQQLPRCRWVTLFSRAPVRLTFTPKLLRRLLYTHWTRPKDGYAAMSKASILSVLGLTWQGERPRLYLTEAERAWGRQYLQGLGVGPGDILVTLDPSHRRETRRWPAGHFARLADLAVAAEPRLKFLVLWGPGEEGLAREVAAVPARRERLLVPERLLSLREMAAVIAQARAHLGTCSAPRHFAVALGVASFVVLGSTSQAWTYPAPEHRDVALGLSCQPCNENSCAKGEPICLTRLTPEAVAPRFLDFLRETGEKGARA